MAIEIFNKSFTPEQLLCVSAGIAALPFLILSTVLLFTERVDQFPAPPPIIKINRRK